MPMRAAKEQRLVWTMPDLDDVELSRATYTTHEFAPHAHETLSIAVIEKGVSKFWCRGRSWNAEPGTLVLLSPDEVHTGGAATPEPMSYRMIYVGEKVLERSSARPNIRPPSFRSPIVSSSAFGREFRALHADLEAHPNAAEQDGRLFDVIERLLIHYGDWKSGEIRVSDPGPVQKVREIIRAEYAGPVSLSTLAKRVDRHPSYLNRLFRKHVGLPPHHYLIQVRIARARDLLRAGKSPAETAALTGFVDQSHLTRMFKSFVGTTPADYRQQILMSGSYKIARSGMSHVVLR